MRKTNNSIYALYLKSLLFKLLKPVSAKFFVLLHKEQSNFLNIPTPAFTLSFDCDLEKDTFSLPEISKVLRTYNLKASFACIGFWIERYPQLYKCLIADGHELINHTYSHPDNIELNLAEEFHKLPQEAMRQEIERCHNICQGILNYKPAGFRAPHFGKSFTYDFFPLLEGLGYKYDTSTIDWRVNKAGAPFKKNGIFEIPLTCFPHAPFTLMDTWTAMHCNIGVFNDFYLSEFALLCKIIKKYSLYLTVYLDPLDVVECNLLQPMCEIIKENKINILRYCDLFEESGSFSQLNN